MEHTCLGHRAGPMIISCLRHGAPRGRVTSPHSPTEGYVRGCGFWPERGWVRTSWEPPAPCSPWDWGSGLPPAHHGVSRTFLLQPVCGRRRNRPSSPAWPPEGRAGILSGLEAPSWPGGESRTAQHALAASGHLAGPGAGERRRGGQSERRVAAQAAGVAACLAGRGLLLPDAQTWLGLSCC